MDIKFGQQLFSLLDVNSDNILDNQDLNTTNQTNKLILQELGITENGDTQYTFEQLHNSIESLTTDNSSIDNMLSDIKTQSLALQSRGEKPSMGLELPSNINNKQFNSAEEFCANLQTNTENIKDSIQDNNSQNIAISHQEAVTENSTSGITEMNGEIDNSFKQGQVGDCWLLGSIQAIAQNEKGKQLLNDSIKILDNGNVEVTLKGVNKTYTFTQEEIKNRKELSSGDLDVRALEMAVQKYIEENPDELHSWSDQFEGNSGHTAFKILVGGKNKESIGGFLNSSTTKWNITDRTINHFNDLDCIAVTASSSKKNYAFVDGNGKQQELLGHHMYAIKGSDEQNVYLVNPHDTSKVITVPRNEYKKFFKIVEKCKI